MKFTRSIFDDCPPAQFKLWYKPQNKEFNDEEAVMKAWFGKKDKQDSDEIVRRWYYLTKTCIYYKKSPEDEKIRGILDLKFTRVYCQVLDNPLYEKYRYSFCFVRNKKSTEIYTDDQETFDDWKDVLRLLTIQTDFHASYNVIKMIGEGSFARVYLASKIDSENQEEYVAIKAFSKERLLAKENGVDNIREEIEITWYLSNKHIIQMRELHETENTLYMVLELLEGGEIFSLSSGGLEYKHAIHILGQLLEGLRYLSRNNIMHRDLKPENIVLKFKGIPLEENQIKIVDFGLSAYKDDKDHCFVKCGTPGYVAPEVINCQSASKVPYDTKCDIFSLGIIFFFMLTGVMPYDGEDFMEVLSNNKKGYIDFDIPELNNYSPDVIKLLRGMLERDPQKRLSADDIVEDGYFEELSKSIPKSKKFASVESLDTMLQKFKDKFKNKKEIENTSMSFNIHPDMQNGTNTYGNLSENPNNGSNRDIKSIDNSVKDHSDNESSKPKETKNVNNNKARDNYNLRIQTLKQATHTNAKIDMLDDMYSDDEQSKSRLLQKKNSFDTKKNKKQSNEQKGLKNYSDEEGMEE